MVCNRCKLVVKLELEKMKLTVKSIELGEVEIIEDLSNSQKGEVAQRLVKLGFEWMDDKKSRTIEKIKTLIIDLIYNQNSALDTNLSDYLAKQILQDYSTLSSLFSDVEGITIEKYFIQQKIERVKELLIYDELNLNEIATLLHYSSTAHLSAQFKKITGLTPSYYKQLKDKKRKQIDLL